MVNIRPFRALRPTQSLAPKVASLPYDVCNVAEARQFAGRPEHFYHITRAEIDLPESVDVHSGEVYGKALSNLKTFIHNGILKEDTSASYFIYRLIMDRRSQTGLLCLSSIEDYDKGLIKKHEYTRPEKEKDRIDHMLAVGAQTGVVFLAYRDRENMNRLVEDWKQSHAPENDFTSEDGVQHTIWVVNDEDTVRAISSIFLEEVPATYIADGHHRAASASRVAQRLSDNPDAQYFLTCIFPESELKILDYNRVVKDLNGMGVEAFIEALKKDFEVSPAGREAYRPAAPWHYGVYAGGAWYELVARQGTFDSSDPIGQLDVQILQDNVLSKILNINDPRTDNRVEFVGGIRGLQELEKRVDSGDCTAAFSCYPVSMDQLFSVADSGNVMPPKSTWFEPKTRDGLVTYVFDRK